MYTYIYYTIYIYYIYIHRYILAYIQPAPRYSRICYTRTNRYDCVSLGSLVPPLLFFPICTYIYIYISYTCTLSISRSPLPLFFLQSSISFFSSVSLVRSRYRGDISVSGLNSSRSPLRSPEREREREFSRNGLQDHRATLRKGTRTGRIGAGRCDGIDGRVAPTSRAVKLNAYLRGSNEN